MGNTQTVEKKFDKDLENKLTDIPKCITKINKNCYNLSDKYNLKKITNILKELNNILEKLKTIHKKLYIKKFILQKL
jgi:hypothetical protein